MPTYVYHCDHCGFNPRLREGGEYAARLSKVFKTEVRWNYEGLSQGHYINVN